MPKKLVLSDGEYEVLLKLLHHIPPAKLPFPDFDGSDLFYYRELLTHILHENFRFSDTDE